MCVFVWELQRVDLHTNIIEYIKTHKFIQTRAYFLI